MSIVRRVVPQSIKQKIKKSIGTNDTFSLNQVVDKIADRKLALMTEHGKTGRFMNQVVVVTGATGSIGSDICKGFSNEGAKVVLCGRNTEKVNQLKEEIEMNGNHQVFTAVFDITSASQIEKAFEDINSQFGKIDVLVNCAGGSAREHCEKLADQSVEIIDKILNLNLRAPILCSRIASVSMMKQKSGSIVNFSSLMGLRGKAGYVEYGAAKAGIDGLTRALAVELGNYNINVNSVIPSYVPCVEITEKRADELLHSNFMNTIGSSADITSAVMFLSSKEARFITGQNLIIDGGRSLGMKGE